MKIGLGDFQIFRGFFWGFGPIFQRVCTVVLQKIVKKKSPERRVNSRRSQSLSNFPCSNWSEGSHVGRARPRCGQHRFLRFYIVLWMRNWIFTPKSNQNEVDSQEGLVLLIIYLLILMRS